MAKISKTKHITKRGVVKKNPKKKSWKRYTPEQFHKLGHPNVDGYVVEFREPLYVGGYDKPVKLKDGGERISIFPVVRTKEPIAKFMKVKGGFGSSFTGVGRMLIGDFYESLEDVDKKHPIGWDSPEYDWGGNTKEGYIYVWAKK